LIGAGFGAPVESQPLHRNSAQLDRHIKELVVLTAQAFAPWPVAHQTAREIVSGPQPRPSL